MTTELKDLPIDLSRKYTAQEFERLEDDSNRYELIGGKLTMSPPPEARHADISDELLTALKNFLKANPGIGKVWSHAGFNIGKKPNGKDNILEPDLGFIVASRLPADDAGYLPYPDLVVEVWSLQSDLADANTLKKAREKLEMYLKVGTRISWGINLVKLEVEIQYLDPTKRPVTLTLEDELEGEELIPGFKMSLRDLFGK